MIFFHSQHLFIYLFILLTQNWSMLISKLLHRPQTGEALCARVFNRGNSSMYSWVKIAKGYKIRGFTGSSLDKEPTCQCMRCSFDPWVGKIPWRREWKPTPISLPGESHGQRSLVGDSPWGRKEWTTTVWLNNWTCLLTNYERNWCFPSGLGPWITSKRVLRALCSDTEPAAPTVVAAPRGWGVWSEHPGPPGLASFEQEFTLAPGRC